MTKHTTEAGMLAEQGRAIVFDDGPFGQPGTCSECGDDCPDVDEATELCEMCFEHIFGEGA
jgi:hypothetical protein